MQQIICKRFQEFLCEKEIEGAVILRPENVCYLTGYYVNWDHYPISFVVPNEGEPSIVVSSLEESYLKDATWVRDVRTYVPYGLERTLNPENEMWKILIECTKRLGLEDKVVGSDMPTFSERLKEDLDVLSVADVYSKLDSMRMIKTSEEVAEIRKACWVADVGGRVVMEEPVEGMTEIELNSKVDNEMIVAGSRLHKFGIIRANMNIVCGKRSGILPYWAIMIPTNRQLEKGDFVMGDGGAQVRSGYRSDICRTGIVGRPSKKQEEVYNIVLEAEETGIREVKPGVTAAYLDKVMRDIIAKAGYRDHTTPLWNGHGIGLAREAPEIAKFDNTVLKEGMVFTLEPGIYLPDVGGVRIEDMIVVTKAGSETLSKCRKELW